MSASPDLASRYLELLKKSLVNDLYIENEARLLHTFACLANKIPLDLRMYLGLNRDQREIIRFLSDAKQMGSTAVVQVRNADGSLSKVSDLRNITELSHTMIGRLRMDNLHFCMESVLRDNIPGDFIETGVWRGGATIFMRGVLAAHHITDRTVWVADSFQGVPPPTLAEEEGLDLSKSVLPVLAVSLERVRELFSRYGLLDDQVQFLKGWFKDTLPTAPIEKLAVLRLDGDLYESTMDALNPLYDKVSPGGYIIVDDYEACPPCKKAIEEFRSRRGIGDELKKVDEQCVYWRKS